MTLQHTKQITAQLSAIPKEKLSRKILKTVIGALFAALGFYLIYTEAKHPPVSVTVLLIGIGLVMVGATVWAGEIVTAPLRIVLALVRDAFAAVKPSKGDS